MMSVDPYFLKHFSSTRIKPEPYHFSGPHIHSQDSILPKESTTSHDQNAFNSLTTDIRPGLIKSRKKVSSLTQLNQIAHPSKQMLTLHRLVMQQRREQHPRAYRVQTEADEETSRRNSGVSQRVLGEFSKMKVRRSLPIIMNEIPAENMSKDGNDVVEADVRQENVRLRRLLGEKMREIELLKRENEEMKRKCNGNYSRLMTNCYDSTRLELNSNSCEESGRGALLGKLQRSTQIDQDALACVSGESDSLCDDKENIPPNGSIRHKGSEKSLGKKGKHNEMGKLALRSSRPVKRLLESHHSGALHESSELILDSPGKTVKTKAKETKRGKTNLQIVVDDDVQLQEGAAVNHKPKSGQKTAGMRASQKGEQKQGNSLWIAVQKRLQTIQRTLTKLKPQINQLALENQSILRL